MRKVAHLFRYRDVSLAANGRYLEALAVVNDPSAALDATDASSKPAIVFLQTFIGMRLADPTTAQKAPVITVPVY